MATVGTLSVDLIAQTASFNANITKAAANLNSNAARMNRSLASVNQRFDSMANAARTASFALAGVGFAQLVKQSLDYAGSLGEVAQQVGVTTRELQVYRALGLQVGVTQEEMDTGLAKLTVSLGKASVGAKAQGDAFAALGISVQAANGHVKTAGQVLPEIADKIAAIQDPAQRAAVEIALFGRAGQKLDTILTGGKEGIADYTKRAEDMGMILGDDLVKSADAAADRISELNAQLKANIAREVAANADAILGLANALASLTVGAIRFISTYPKLSGALAGAAIGARLAGPTGGAIGAGVGALVGEVSGRTAADNNMDPTFRARQLTAVLQQQRRLLTAKPETVFALHRSSADGGTLESVTTEVRRQTSLLKQATAQSRARFAALPPGVDLPDFLASGGAGGGGRGRRVPKGPAGPSAESLRQRAIRDAEAFANNMASLDGDLLGAKRDNIADVKQLAEIAKQQLTVEMDKLAAGVTADVALGKYSAAQGALLQEKIAQLRNERMLTITSEELQKKWNDELDLEIAANDNQQALLNVQEQLAVTQADRRKIQLAILDAEKQNLTLELQKALLNSKDIEERKRIQAKLDAVPGVYDAKGAAVRQQTRGPMEQYTIDTHRSADQLNEDYQKIAAGGLQAFNDGIVDAIMGAKSLADVFHAVANQIIADLLRIAVQKYITNAIAGFLFPGGGASLPGHAMGTNSAAPGLAVVGERGPEIVRFRGGEQVIPNHMLRAANNNSGHTFNINVAGPMSHGQARETGEQVGRAALRTINGPLRRG